MFDKNSYQPFIHIYSYIHLPRTRPLLAMILNDLQGIEKGKRKVNLSVREILLIFVVSIVQKRQILINSLDA